MIDDQLTSAERYGRVIAPIYDMLYPAFDPKLFVDRFSEFARPGARVVEAGAGTGRVALPLAAGGFAVTAVDASRDMLLELQAKDPARRVAVELADITAADLALEADVVAILNSTLFMLDSQARQARFLQNAARWLTPGGVLVVEAYNPHVTVPREGHSQQFTVLADGTSILFDIIQSDPCAQTLTLLRHYRGERAISFVETSRYAHRGELDLLAANAGFRPLTRWGDWTGAPDSAEAAMPISVYRLADAG